MLDILLEDPLAVHAVKVSFFRPYLKLFTCRRTVRWRGGRLAFIKVKCLKEFFLHRTEPKQRFNIGRVEVGGRESPEVGRTLVEDLTRAVSKLWPWLKCVSMVTNWIKMRTQYIHRNGLSHYFLFWKVAPLFGYLCYLFPYCACVSRPLKCKRQMDR